MVEAWLCGLLPRLSWLAGRSHQPPPPALLGAVWSDSLPLPPAPGLRCSCSRPGARRLLPPALRVDPLLLLPGMEKGKERIVGARPAPSRTDHGPAPRAGPAVPSGRERGSRADTRAGANPPRDAGAAAAGGAGGAGGQAGTLGQRGAPTPHSDACTEGLVMPLRNRGSRWPTWAPHPETHLPLDPRALANGSAQPCPGFSETPGTRGCRPARDTPRGTPGRALAYRPRGSIR